jgi:hypothetical protein
MDKATKLVAMACTGWFLIGLMFGVAIGMHLN